MGVSVVIAHSFLSLILVSFLLHHLLMGMDGWGECGKP